MSLFSWSLIRVCYPLLGRIRITSCLESKLKMCSPLQSVLKLPVSHHQASPKEKQLRVLLLNHAQPSNIQAHCSMSSFPLLGCELPEPRDYIFIYLSLLHYLLSKPSCRCSIIFFLFLFFNVKTIWLRPIRKGLKDREWKCFHCTRLHLRSNLL